MKTSLMRNAVNSLERKNSFWVFYGSSYWFIFRENECHLDIL